VLHLILVHVNSNGWENCAWSDDTLSLKKLYSNFQFACPKKAWLPRMKTCDESVSLAVQNIQSSHVRGSSKATSLFVEDASLKAAACWHLGQELLTQVPVESKKLDEVWYQSFRDGDSSVKNEISCVLMDKSDNFDVKKDIPILKRLVDEQSYAKPVASTQIEEVQLQVDKFSLVKKQLDYDVQVYNTWSRKCSSVKSAQEHQRHMWLLQRRQRCEAAAQAYINNSLKILVWDRRKCETAIAEVMNYKKELSQKHGYKLDDISHLVFWNCSAPCLIPAPIVKNSVSLLTWALNDQMRSVALILSPTFTYSKGKLILEEQSLLNDVAMAGNHVLDWIFTLVFGSKSDARDLRPMVYHGRFVFPAPLDLGKNPFFHCQLRKDQRTAEVKQVPAREMREVECVDESALPSSTNASDVPITGASKYWQIGSLACQELLSSSLTGVSPEPAAVIVIDVFPRNGDMTEAFCKAKSSLRTSLHYICFAESQDEGTYIETYLREILAQSYENGMPTATGEKIEQTMSADLTEALPPTPRLNLLVPGFKTSIPHPIQEVLVWGKLACPGFGASLLVQGLK